jgi:single stranded DNA-binding protein
VAEFSIAVNRPIRKDDGSFEDSLDGFFDCQLYGDVAFALKESCSKGSEVQVTGSLHQRKWKVGEGAGARTASKIEVKAKTVAPLLHAPRTEQASDSGTGAEAPVQEAPVQEAPVQEAPAPQAEQQQVPQPA